jgi:hypothetical protein
LTQVTMNVTPDTRPICLAKCFVSVELLVCKSESGRTKCLPHAYAPCKVPRQEVVLMRIERFAVAVVGVSFMVVGCGIPVDIDKTIPLELRAQDTCADVQKTVSLAGEPTFEKYKSKITGIKIQKVFLTVTNPKATLDSEASTIEGTLSLVNADQSKSTLGALSTLALSQGASQEITVDKGTADALAAALLASPHSATLEAHACADEAPVGVDTELRVELQVLTKL